MSSSELRRLMTLLEDATNSAMSVNKKQIAALVKKYFMTDTPTVQVEDDGTVNVKGTIYPHNRDTYVYKQFPVKFGKIDGNFNVQGCGLTTLIGGPTEVGGNFTVSNNKLTSLKGSPKLVGGHYVCRGNPLVSVEELPQSFTGLFVCDWHPDLPLLRLLRCKRVYVRECDTVADILRKYAGNPSRSNILACQKELIDAGFEGNAAW